MFGKRIGFLKFTADVYDRVTGKKVNDHVYTSVSTILVERQAINRGNLSNHLEIGHSLFFYLMHSSSYFCLLKHA